MAEKNRPRSASGRGDGRRWRRGQSGNPSGRPKGLPNKATAELRAFAREVLDTPGYRRSLTRRLLKGTLAPALEQMLFFYAYGKPKDHVRIEAEVEELRVRIIDDHKEP
jgi:hypothetical protein